MGSNRQLSGFRIASSLGSNRQLSEISNPQLCGFSNRSPLGFRIAALWSFRIASSVWVRSLTTQLQLSLAMEESQSQLSGFESLAYGVRIADPWVQITDLWARITLPWI